jgi:predicted flavoprotein YhiN
MMAEYEVKFRMSTDGKLVPTDGRMEAVIHAALNECMKQHNVYLRVTELKSRSLP